MKCCLSQGEVSSTELSGSAIHLFFVKDRGFSMVLAVCSQELILFACVSCPVHSRPNYTRFPSPQSVAGQSTRGRGRGGMHLVRQQ